MANFCKYCGKALQDGEICSCPQAQAEAAQQYQGYQSQQPPQEAPQGYQPPQGPQDYQQPPQDYQQPPQNYQPQPAGPNSFAVGLQRIPSFLSSYFKAPVSAVQALVNAKDVIVAGALLVVQIIISGLLLFSALDSVSDSYSAAYSFGDDYSKAAIVLGTGLSAVNEDLSASDMREGPSFPLSWLMGILIAAICVVVYVLVIFASAKIAGSRASFTDAIVAAGGHSLYVTILLLLSFITFFMLFELGAIFFTAAMLVWLVLTAPAVQTITHPSTTKEGTLWICVALGVVITVVFCGWLSAMMMSVPLG